MGCPLVENRAHVYPSAAALAKGRVFGRPASVGLVWWLSSEGCVYNGSNEVPLFPDDPTWSESLAGTSSSKASSVWKFRAGDIVQVKLEQAQVSFRINNRSWSHPASVAPMAAGMMLQGHSRAMSPLARSVLTDRNLPVARGSATTEGVQRDGLEVVELAVQMLGTVKYG